MSNMTHAMKGTKITKTKDRPKSNYKTQQEIQNKNRKVKDKNTKCVKQKQRIFFIMLKYEDLNMKRPKQGYGSRLYLKLVLNILKVMRVIPLFTPF